MNHKDENEGDKRNLKVDFQFLVHIHLENGRLDSCQADQLKKTKHIKIARVCVISGEEFGEGHRGENVDNETTLDVPDCNLVRVVNLLRHLRVEVGGAEHNYDIDQENEVDDCIHNLDLFRAEEVWRLLSVESL